MKSHSEIKKIFYSKTKIPNDDGCMIWEGGKDCSGRGRITISLNPSSFLGVTRFSYKMHYGTFDKKLYVLNRCKNNLCVSPSHLYLSHSALPCQSIEDRFWLNIKKHPSGCWIWIGGKTGAGYGALQEKGKFIMAHRLSWEIHNKKLIPEGMVIMHKCDTPSCCSPHHLCLGTHKDNMKDKMSKGRWAGVGVGENHPGTNLTDKMVKEMKDLISRGASLPDLAKKYNTSYSIVLNIRAGRCWRHIE